jgi:hypothetical protein
MKNTSSPHTPGQGFRQVRPPSQGTRAPSPGVSEPQLRTTASVRAVVSPVLGSAPSGGYSPSHEYVRRFWIAVLGPGAVADLLRLTAAAQSGRSLKEPVHLPMLLAAGLAIRISGSVIVNDTVPPVPAHLVRRMPPALRRAHARAVPLSG